MTCEDKINFYCPFDEFRKNDCRSDISHSLSFSQIFPSPFKPEFTIKIVIQYKPQITVTILNCQIVLKAASQPPVSLQLAARQPASCQPAASQPPASRHPAVILPPAILKKTLAIYIGVYLYQDHLAHSATYFLSKLTGHEMWGHHWFLPFF